MSNISQHINSKYILQLWETLVIATFSLQAICVYFVLFFFDSSICYFYQNQRMSIYIVVYIIRWLPAFLKSTRHLAWTVFTLNEFEKKYTLSWCKIRSTYDLLIYVTMRTIKCVYYIQQVFYNLVMMKMF